MWYYTQTESVEFQVYVNVIDALAIPILASLSPGSFQVFAMKLQH